MNFVALLAILAKYLQKRTTKHCDFQSNLIQKICEGTNKYIHVLKNSTFINLVSLKIKVFWECSFFQVILDYLSSAQTPLKIPTLFDGNISKCCTFYPVTTISWSHRVLPPSKWEAFLITNSCRWQFQSGLLWLLFSNISYHGDSSTASPLKVFALRSTAPLI